jgi:DNA mismatch repair protein MutS
VRTLFATHYHELTQLSRAHEGIRSYHAQVREWNDEIIFLRKVVEGSADKSYGIEVGRLAGLPTEIIKRAKILLQQLETTDLKAPLFEVTCSMNPPVPQPLLPRGITERVGVDDLFSSAPSVKPHPILEKLQSIDPDAITPIQALELLYDLSEQAKKETG